MSNLSYDLEEIFDLKTAQEYLKEGYYVRHIHWAKGAFIYVEDGMYYNEEDINVGKYILEANKTFEFQLVNEDELCVNVEKEDDGTQGLVEQKNKSQEEKNVIKNESEENILNHHKQGNAGLSDNVSITEKTKRNATENELNAEEEILKQTENTIVNTTSEIKEDYSPKSLQQEEGVIQQSDYSILSSELKKEKSSSIELLNGSTQLMMNLATDLTEAKEGAVPSKENIKTATELLKEVRNTMKTKLEYLKFAKDIMK